MWTFLDTSWGDLSPRRDCIHPQARSCSSRQKEQKGSHLWTYMSSRAPNWGSTHSQGTEVQPFYKWYPTLWGDSGSVWDWVTYWVHNKAKQEKTGLNPQVLQKVNQVKKLHSQHFSHHCSGLLLHLQLQEPSFVGRDGPNSRPFP